MILLLDFVQMKHGCYELPIVYGPTVVNICCLHQPNNFRILEISTHSL
uniref:Uncharacterized protein n=1 Tax=Rhizophora mucronata TaxID=61149 RepID=A0A2P2P922_RHIMU